MFLAVIAPLAVLAACGGAGDPAPTWTAGPTLGPSDMTAANTIVVSQWKVEVASTFKAGMVTFSISNQGTIQHELLVFKSDLAPSEYPTDSAGRIREDGPGIKLVSDGDNIDPQATQSRTVDLSPGTYLFVCNIPGHFRAGMHTVVTVTA